MGTKKRISAELAQPVQEDLGVELTGVFEPLMYGEVDDLPTSLDVVNKPLGLVRNTPVSLINMASQVRRKVNSKSKDLTHSIMEEGGVDTPVIAAILPAHLVQEYLDFSNKTWRRDPPLSLADMTPWPNEPEHYLMLIGGHSRVLSVRHIVENYTLADGTPLSGDQFVVSVNFKKIQSIDQILRKQIAENIHSNTPRERELLGIAEMYHWLKRKHGNKFDPERYARSHKLSSQDLEDAVAFSSLPSVIVESVYEGTVPMSLAMHWGYGYKKMLRSVAMTYGMALAEAQELQCADDLPDEGVRDKITTELELNYMVYAARFNGRLQKRHVSKGVAHFDAVLAEIVSNVGYLDPESEQFNNDSLPGLEKPFSVGPTEAQGFMFSVQEFDSFAERMQRLRKVILGELADNRFARDKAAARMDQLIAARTQVKAEAFGAEPSLEVTKLLTGAAAVAGATTLTHEAGDQELLFA